MKTKKIKSLLAITGLLLTFNAQAAIHYVKADGTGAGTSWSDAAGSIQPMIDKAVVGDEIWIAQGTYYPTLETEARDARSKTFVLKDGVHLYGGFAGTETDVNSRVKVDQDENGTVEAWEFANETVLSGDIDGVEDVWKKVNDNGTIATGTSWRRWSVSGITGNCYRVVTCQTKFLNETKFDGFTVKGSTNSGIKAEGKTIINNCTVSHNYVSGSGAAGGGIYNIGGTINNCTVSHNSAYGYSYGGGGAHGGGIYNTGGTINNCTVSHNSAYNSGFAYEYGGGGIFNIGGTINNCTVSHNSAYGSGGGIYNTGGTISNCTVSHNSAAYSTGYGGGGIINMNSGYSSGTGTISNCIVSNNSIPVQPESYGSGIYNSRPYYNAPGTTTSYGYVYCSTIVNNDYYPKSDSHSYNNITSSTNAALNFINPEQGDWRLKEGSQYINAGSTANLPDKMNEVDWDGNPRIALGQIDLGVYEYVMPVVTFPFIEDFSSCADFFESSYLYGAASSGGMNNMSWKIEDGKAVFDYTNHPNLKDYSRPFFSYTLDGTTNASIILKYDLAFQSYGGVAASTNEQLSVEYSIDFKKWETIANYTNVNGNIVNQTYQHDISDKVAGKEFYIRFRAHGENSNNIEKWEVDNIIVKSATDSDPIPTPTTNVIGVTLNTPIATLVVSTTEQLVATIQPANATNTAVTWSSDNTTVATVSADGLVTAKATGTAIIAVTSIDGGKRATCVVTVTGGTAIDDIDKDKISIKSVSNGITIETEEATPVSVFNIAGQKVYQSVVTGSAEIHLNKGVYIVKANSGSRKIIVK